MVVDKNGEQSCQAPGGPKCSFCSSISKNLFTIAKDFQADSREGRLGSALEVFSKGAELLTRNEDILYILHPTT